MKNLNKLKFICFIVCFSMIITTSGCNYFHTLNTSQINVKTNVSKDGGSLLVYFLDVGQGNAVVVEEGEEYLLIDGGDSDYSSYVVSYLKKLGVTELEYIVSSHYDSDHVNGLIGALNVFDVKNVLDADYITDSKVYRSFIHAVEEEKTNEIHPSQGDIYQLGNAVITVVCPENYKNEDENNNSVGVRIVYGNTSFLICGDAEIESETQMIESGEELASDVYMCSHHGSKTAASEAFLKNVNPQYAVISAGAGNQYGHPDEEVMERLKEQEIKIFRTDEQGTVIAESDGDKITWNTEASSDYRSGEEVSKELPENEEEDKADVKYLKSDADCQKEQTFILNISTKKYHLPDCKYAEEISEKNRKEVTTTREKLEEEGYSPCKVCIGDDE